MVVSTQAEALSKGEWSKNWLRVKSSVSTRCMGGAWCHCRCGIAASFIVRLGSHHATRSDDPARTSGSGSACGTVRMPRTVAGAGYVSGRSLRPTEAACGLRSLVRRCSWGETAVGFREGRLVCGASCPSGHLRTRGFPRVMR
jgi:hypothetical protein